MPMDLLYALLALVYEQKLGGNTFSIIPNHFACMED